MWVGQSDATAAQRRLQSPVLFAHEVDDIALLLLEPSEEPVSITRTFPHALMTNAPICANVDADLGPTAEFTSPDAQAAGIYRDQASVPDGTRHVFPRVYFRPKAAIDSSPCVLRREIRLLPFILSSFAPYPRNRTHASHPTTGFPATAQEEEHDVYFREAIGGGPFGGLASSRGCVRAGRYHRCRPGYVRRVLPGVTVEAASPVLIERMRSVVSDDTGQYRIVDLRPGTYAVTFRCRVSTPSNVKASS